MALGRLWGEVLQGYRRFEHSVPVCVRNPASGSYAVDQFPERAVAMAPATKAHSDPYGTPMRATATPVVKASSQLSGATHGRRRCVKAGGERWQN